MRVASPRKNDARRCSVCSRKCSKHIDRSYGGRYGIGPTVQLKNDQVYIYLFVFTIFGPIYYGPP